MPVTLRGPLLVLAATVIALGLVPGSSSSPRAGNADAHQIAVGYLSQNAAELGVGRADVADLAVTSNYRSRASGITHVNLNQRYQGLEVFGGHVTVNVAPDGAVVFAGGDLVDGLKAATAATPAVGAVAAVEAAADALELDEPDDLRVLSSRGGRAQETVVSDGGISAAAIPARLGWQPTASGLRLAWQLVIDAVSEEHLWNATVDANSAKLLDADDWTVHDDLGSLATTLSRSSEAQSTATATSLGTPAPVEDGSSYRVLAVPTESPNDADRVLLTNPADALASPFGWHDTNGASGAEFTITRGNNVHAYLDQEDDEAPDFGDTDGGAGLDFDFPADLSEHAQHYRDAVVTNLFYGCNAFHDIYYRYGFDEASGNFQANNYGRGGLEGDYVRCEAADGSGTNNANFSTPTEPTLTGAVPRMQMFLWPGNQLGPQNQVLVNGVTSIGAGWARFGPPATRAGVSGTVVLVNDGLATPPVGTVNDGCESYPLPPNSIALVDRANTPPAPPTLPPTCSFLQQVQNAAAAGALAVIIANNTGGNAPIINGPTSAPTPNIPAVSLTQDNGTALKELVPTPAIVRKHPDHPGIRDGDLENGIIFHEYGHGLSNRLTGGPAVNCLSGNEQAGEGWSDYVAIAAMLDPALDDPNGPRGMGPYALFQANRQGNGIRPRPYSRNMEIQPFTYDSIKTNGWLNGTSLALPHGLGHG